MNTIAIIGLILVAVLLVALLLFRGGDRDQDAGQSSSPAGED
ncbi:MAG: hypothetical protein AAF557_09545 [Pseudomonadota bacterium]